MVWFRVPFISSDNGVLDSILATLGLYGFLIVFVVLLMASMLFFSYLEQNFNIRLGRVKEIFSISIGITVTVIYIFVPFLLLPVLFAGLVLAALTGYLLSKEEQKRYTDTSIHSAPDKSTTLVMDAEFRLVDDPKTGERDEGRKKP